MHIVGLVEDPRHVCCRYRLTAFRRYWKAAGHKLELMAIPRGFWARMQLWRSLRDADVVILQRRLLAGVHLLMLRRNAKRLVFDFDDAVYRRDSYSTKGNDSSRQRRFTATLHAADVIVAGNDYLRQQAARFASESRIHVVPTCVDLHDYTRVEHTRIDGDVQLVWIGSSSTLQGLERQQPLLDTIAKHVRGIQCKIVCDRFPHFKKMHVLPRRWSEATEAAELASSDIGISMVPDDPLSLGKCGLKVLQYMAAGLPVVANPVGVQATMVLPGETGYLAETPTQWVAAIRRLAMHPELRKQMGKAARRHVLQHFSVDIGALKWLEILLGMKEHRRGKAAA